MDGEKKNILIVDDDEIQLEHAKFMLQNDYTILTAKSGKEAVDYFLHQAAPHLVLLDILMPNMDGWETFNQIRGLSLLQNVPIAFLTSLNGTEEEKRAMEMGAADYIMKPFNKEDLLNRVKNIFSK
jgi:CheY-like chemotaxis protein